jgi:hypothetical protein
MVRPWTYVWRDLSQSNTTALFAQEQALSRVYVVMHVPATECMDHCLTLLCPAACCGVFQVAVSAACTQMVWQTLTWQLGGGTRRAERYGDGMYVQQAVCLDNNNSVMHMAALISTVLPPTCTNSLPGIAYMPTLAGTTDPSSPFYHTTQPHACMLHKPTFT